MSKYNSYEDWFTRWGRFKWRLRSLFLPNRIITLDLENRFMDLLTRRMMVYWIDEGNDQILIENFFKEDPFFRSITKPRKGDA